MAVRSDLRGRGRCATDRIEVTEVDREGVSVEGACVEPAVETRECAQVGTAGVGREGVAHQGGSGGRDGRGGPGGRLRHRGGPGGRENSPFVQHPGEPGHVAVAAEAVLGARSHWSAHRHAEPLRKRPANARYGGEAVRREAAAGRRILVRPLPSISIRYRLGVWDMDVGSDLKNKIKQQAIWCSRDARIPEHDPTGPGLHPRVDSVACIGPVRRATWCSGRGARCGSPLVTGRGHNALPRSRAAPPSPARRR